MDLTTALDARDATVCVVGAGGKKSTLFALADRLDRAVVTASVRIPIFDDRVAAVRVTEDPVAALDEVGEGDWPLGLVPERDRSDRYLGYDTATVAEVADAAPGATLVKADGARLREFKAPGEREPQIPSNADVVVPIASAHVVGEPLTDDLVHRPEEVAAITGRETGDEIRPADVATVLASPAGGLKGAPSGATAIPVVNKVDDDADAAAARAVAGEILHRADVPRVLLTRLIADDPVVEVVE
ncbi:MULTISPECIES: selenium cofactor biosynthesis protein YqeC [Halorubrum]|jgi:probable selenium-dependent hydroxylase accessory protein YqeC|uniref:Dehydrogenase n=1 Tax=Halorubrum tropicale TaxID=1765655 RepID=A0A0M9ASZ7_9EURY|nr:MULTISPECIES: selenium cofactor biosynthesis protein YqeC [Halorubrum]KOX96901.1 dehydrogenase [Halorubrum tropicale]TKX45266.1 putative selenium-dependent hydroxylase accessory protein YqeC [Halorubrum sp. ARQ200]TKX51560.1 putative selenium-dependent hydroxylase accessory protein YqeC [Halorubrum sp. ASP121]TKX61258.1 putative selenium-dependent hydroxylase accessory protein YqeC [Halorubrum sp. ASP1]